MRMLETVAELEEKRRQALKDFKAHKVPSYLTLEKLRKLDERLKAARRKGRK